MNNVLNATLSKELESVSFGLTIEKEIELITIAKTGTGSAKRKARNTLLESQLKQIVSVARSFSNNLNSVTDLVSAGAIGFDHAINKFDLTKGVRFVTYYRFWVRDSINRAVHENHTIRPPMNIAKTNSKTDEELGKMPEGNKRKVGDKVHVGFSINTPIGDDSKSTYEDTLQSDECLETILHNKFIMEKALKFIDQSSRAWQMIQCYYLDSMTMAEIGTEFGVTKQAVSLIMNKALKRIRQQYKL